MSENLYPKDAPQTRRKGRRKPRPKHLPPWVPAPAAREPALDAAAAAAKAVAAAPPPPAFGARGQNPALRFHQLKQAPAPSGPAKTPEDDDE